MRLYAPKRDALTGEWNPPPVLKTEAAPDGAAHYLKKLQIFFWIRSCDEHIDRDHERHIEANMVQSVAYISCVKAPPIPSRLDLWNRRAHKRSVRSEQVAEHKEKERRQSNRAGQGQNPG